MTHDEIVDVFAEQVIQEMTLFLMNFDSEKSITALLRLVYSAKYLKQQIGLFYRKLYFEHSLFFTHFSHNLISHFTPRFRVFSV